MDAYKDASLVRCLLMVRWTYWVGGFERETKLDRVLGILVSFELHEGARLSEVALAPGPLERDDGLSVDQRADEVPGLKERGGTVGENHGELFAHELLRFPWRALDGDARGHSVPLDSLDVHAALEQSLTVAAVH